jgi:DNA-directed RNA polymerase specialized sigma24 family protein
VKDLAEQQDRSYKAVESDLFRAREEFRFLWMEMEILEK